MWLTEHGTGTDGWPDRPPASRPVQDDHVPLSGSQGFVAHFLLHATNPQTTFQLKSLPLQLIFYPFLALSSRQLKETFFFTLRRLLCESFVWLCFVPASRISDLNDTLIDRSYIEGGRGGGDERPSDRSGISFSPGTQ